VDVTGLQTWHRIEQLRDVVGAERIRDLLSGDPSRAERYVVSGAGLTLDYSRQRVNDDVIEALVALAEERDLSGAIEAMYRGDRINVTENRSVLHTALRRPRGDALVVEGTDVVAEVHRVLDRMAAFANSVRNRTWLGHTGQPITTVVNIGIGGSDLGPVMANLALREYSDRGLTFRFVSNVDGIDIHENLLGLDAATTLFIVASKTFTTQETMANAHAARNWLREQLGDDVDVAKHFVALSTNAEKVGDFGIDTANMFGFWEWVGGRYSMDSAIGLSTMIAIGPEGFSELLGGFHAMDEHFRTAPFCENLPALMGLLGIWNRNFLGYPTVAVLPYEQYLVRFPAYLQQLIMESNGKSVHLDGTPVTTSTGAIYWGEPGTNGQHSFYQLIHQGTDIIPTDVIFFAEPLAEVGQQHDLLIANAVAQAAVFALGRTAEEVAADGTPADLVPHKVMPGNRPCSVLTGQRLTPAALGALVALYEHMVFTQGVIWGIGPFDQWGVQLGKLVADQIAPQLIDGAEAPAEQDPATTATVARYRAARGRG
jgi:glucose-6-phosphate isomerase